MLSSLLPSPKTYSPMSSYFSGIEKINYEGPDSDNPLAFHHYNPTELVAGKPMKDHLRFGAAYWHCMRNELADPFGAGTALMPWDDGSASEQNALKRADVFFEFLEKIGIDYYCFHDRDIAPEGDSVAESEKHLQHVVNLAKERQAETGLKLLWGTANVFSHPRYMNGASTNPDFDVVAHADDL